MELKLFMENFDPKNGTVSYVVENESGDRLGRGEITQEKIKNYSPATMDFFVLGFLPRLEELQANLNVQGPLSVSLNSILGNNISADVLVEGTGRTYKKEDIEIFKKIFIETRDLNETLSRVFNYFD